MKSKLILVSFVCLSCLVAQVFSIGFLTKALVAKKLAAVGLGALAAKKVAATLALKGLAAVVKKGAVIKGAGLAAAKGVAVKGAILANGAALGNRALWTPPFFPYKLQLIQPFPYQFYNPYFTPYNQMPFLRAYRLNSQKPENVGEERLNSEKNDDLDAPEKKNNELRTPSTRAAKNDLSADYEMLKFE